jgi:hypothetical protein
LPWRAPQITGVYPAATSASGAASAAAPSAWSARTGASTAGPTRSGSSAAAGDTPAEAEARSRTSASPATRSAAAFRGENHLQHFVGIFKEVAELVAVRAQSFRRELRGNLDSSDGRIFRDIANLVHLDAGFAGERGLQLLG